MKEVDLLSVLELLLYHYTTVSQCQVVLERNRKELKPGGSATNKNPNYHFKKPSAVSHQGEQTLQEHE